MSVSYNQQFIPVTVCSLSVDEGALVLTQPAAWSEFLARSEARALDVRPSVTWIFALSRCLPRAELYAAFLMSFGPPNDLFDDYKQTFSWWLNLTVDVGHLMQRDAPGPVLHMILRASDYRGGTRIMLAWPGAAPPEAAAFTSEVYDRLLARLTWLVGYRVGYLRAQGLLPDWHLRCPETKGSFGCRGVEFFDEDGRAAPG